MARKSPVRENVEYAALRTACAVVNAVPYPLAMAAAGLLGRFAFSVLRLNRRRTMDRLRAVFPDRSARDLRRIARLSLTNVLKTAVEMMRAPQFDRAWIDRHVDGVGECAAKLRALLDEGRGVVIMVPHSGNWYMAAWAMARYGMRLSAIAAKQRNPKIDAWMKRRYGEIDVVDRGDVQSLSEILRRLRAGGGFAILPDLRVPQPDVEVGFLGGTANVSHGGALFAVKCGSPIVVAVLRRAGGRHVFDYLATLRPDPRATDDRAEAARLTREAMTRMDAKIREFPESWYWYNKRWILQPVAGKSRKGNP